MTNKEFYGDKLLAVALEDACRKLHKTVYGKSCAGKQCEDCGFNDIEDIENWLNAEHEEPLLENGDDLKPGDWIMVRDKNSDEWKKRQFLCFFEGRFCCLDYGCSLQHYTTFYTKKWKQACLPMEGE